jgi:hypothetical protein
LCAPIRKNPIDGAPEAIMIAYRSILATIPSSYPAGTVLYMDTWAQSLLSGVIPSNVHPDQTGHDQMYSFMSAFLTANNVLI